LFASSFLPFSCSPSSLHSLSLSLLFRVSHTLAAGSALFQTGTMRRRASQDYTQSNPFQQSHHYSPQPQPQDPYYQQHGYSSPTTAHQFTGQPQPQLLTPSRQHSPVQQRPPLQPHPSSYNSNDPYNQQGDHTDLYGTRVSHLPSLLPSRSILTLPPPLLSLAGFYSADDGASTSSHTALNMPYSEKDCYTSSSNPAIPSHPPTHLPQYPPPPSPFIGGFAPPPPHSPYAGAPGGYYENSHSAYAQARQGVMKRREKKKVELREGHLVLDLPVARSLAQLGNQAGEIEGESGKLRCEFLPLSWFLKLEENWKADCERMRYRYGCNG